jgi:hypothetical protein
LSKDPRELFSNIINLLDYAETSPHVYDNLKDRKTVNDRIAHTQAEVSEIYLAIQHKEGTNRIISECVDVLLSTASLMVLLQKNSLMSPQDFRLKLLGELAQTVERLDQRIVELKDGNGTVTKRSD